MSETPSRIEDVDAADAAAVASALGGAVATLEQWLRAAVDDPASDLARVHAASLRALAEDDVPLPLRIQLESVASLVEVLGASIAATHRKAVRTGFDIHDGAIQHVLVTGLELQSLRRALQELPPEHGEKPLARAAVVHSRLLAVENDLRELAQSLERPAFADAPLEDSVREVVAPFERDAGIATELEISGEFDQTSRSQRIAVLRVLQGALANVRHHSGASSVRIAVRGSAEGLELSVEDDGGGFDVDAALADATRRGRLGLVAMGERVRLLGGEFDLESRPGGPTRVAISLRPHAT